MRTVIRADRLIDGTGAPALEAGGLVVDGDRITDGFQGDVPEGLRGDDAQVLDYRGCTLLPGLIDSHVHLTLPGDGTSLEECVLRDDEDVRQHAVANAQLALSAGVTLLRDTGGKVGTIFSAREAMTQIRGHGPFPELLLCGHPLTPTRGHTWPLGGEADGCTLLRRKVRELAQLGADWIKVMGTGGGTVNTKPWLSSYSVADLEAVVDEAHRHDLKVTIHCLNAQSMDDAITAGADQIEHGSFFVDPVHQRFDERIVERIATARIAVTPTLSVRAHYVSELSLRESGSVGTSTELSQWQKKFNDTLRIFGRLHEAGVVIVAGTDAGWGFTPFDALPDELRLMSECGMSELDALSSATGIAASHLGVGSRCGTLERGKLANVLAVRGNPLQDIRVLRGPAMIMCRGTVVLAAD